LESRAAARLARQSRKAAPLINGNWAPYPLSGVAGDASTEVLDFENPPGYKHYTREKPGSAGLGEFWFFFAHRFDWRRI
jgi:hypothetical protein